MDLVVQLLVLVHGEKRESRTGHDKNLKTGAALKLDNAVSNCGSTFELHWVCSGTCASIEFKISSD